MSTHSSGPWFEAGICLSTVTNEDLNEHRLQVCSNQSSERTGVLAPCFAHKQLMVAACNRSARQLPHISLLLYFMGTPRCGVTHRSHLEVVLLLHGGPHSGVLGHQRGQRGLERRSCKFGKFSLFLHVQDALQQRARVFQDTEQQLLLRISKKQDSEKMAPALELNNTWSLRPRQLKRTCLIAKPCRNLGPHLLLQKTHRSFTLIGSAEYRILHICFLLPYQ